MLRTALALSLITGRPFALHDIRARRRNPGLARQHLTGERAAAVLCDGEVTGAGVGPTTLRFRPGPVRRGRYRFDIGTAGATSLLLHALYLPLAFASGPSDLVLTGGTHVPCSATFEYLEACWAPLLAAMGIEVRLEFRRAGFYPPGGGELVPQEPTRLLIHGRNYDELGLDGDFDTALFVDYDERLILTVSDGTVLEARCPEGRHGWIELRGNIRWVTAGWIYRVDGHG